MNHPGLLAQTAGGSGDAPHLVIGMLLFVAAGVAMVLGALVFGRFVRPRRPNPEKGETYECGERTIGSGWIQFDLRFYVVALLFVIFDVEIALFWPWAVVYGKGVDGPAGGLYQVRWIALADMLFFFGVVVVGFLYLWKHGYLDWIRTSSASGVRSSEWNTRGLTDNGPTACPRECGEPGPGFPRSRE